MDTIDWRQLTDLEWLQPKALIHSYELRSGASRTVASLEFTSPFGSRATAKVGSDSWTLKRTGFFSPKVTVRLEGREDDIATYVPAFSGSHGVIHLCTGEQLQLKSINFWNTEWTVLDAQQQLMRLHNKGLLHQGASVEVSGPAPARPDLPLLLMLTWYVVVLYIHDSAAG